MKVQTYDILWCVLSNTHIVDNMNSLAYVWVRDGERVKWIKMGLDCDLDISEIWLMAVFSDQVCR